MSVELLGLSVLGTGIIFVLVLAFDFCVKANAKIALLDQLKPGANLTVRSSGDNPFAQDFTIINILGRDNGCESDEPWVRYKVSTSRGNYIAAAPLAKLYDDFLLGTHLLKVEQTEEV